MSLSWGYSPKIEKFIPLGEYPADKYLVVAQQVIENLGWKLSHISQTGLIAYTPVSFQSYSEEISIRIHGNFAVFKSECVGIQFLFNDYGKNALNLEKFFHEFEYAEFHLKDVWDDRLVKFNATVAAQDEAYFEKAPLAVKNKIKNVLYLFFPQKGYTVTPILVILNILAFFGIAILSLFYLRYLYLAKGNYETTYTLEEQAKGLRFISALDFEQVILKNRYWGLISYQFTHASFSHLFFNMYSLVYLGLMIENKLGWKKFIFIYLLSGICAGLISLVFHQEQKILGSSGAIMGLFGAFIALLLNKTFEAKATKALLISTILVAALVLVNGVFSGRTDNAQHIGGLLSGFILAFILSYQVSDEFSFRTGARYGVCSLIFALFFGAMVSFTPKNQTKEFNELCEKFDNNMRNLNAITQLKIDLPKHSKLSSIKEDGIVPMSENLQIIKKMDVLILKSEDDKIRKRKIKLGKVSYKAVMLMYRDINADSTRRYSKQTSEALGQVFRIIYEREGS